MVIFGVRAGLLLAGGVIPPVLGGPRNFVPGKRRGYGDYCIRATCPVRRKGGKPVGVFTGFDTTPGIGDATLRACRLRTRLLPGGEAAHECDPEPQLVFLAHTTMQCSGQIYFMLDGNTTRVL